jgi:hypothetical protein
MTELEQRREYWSRKRRASGHRAAFAAVALCTSGWLSGSHIGDSFETVKRNVGTDSEIYVSVPTLETAAISLGSLGLMIAGFGFALRADSRYRSATEHKEGRKDQFYRPFDIK